MSAAERASSAEQANERADKRVARYLRPDSYASSLMEASYQTQVFFKTISRCNKNLSSFRERRRNQFPIIAETKIIDRK